MSATDWEAKGRAEKVARLVAVIDENASAAELDPCADAEQIARWLRTLEPTVWLGFQRAAGYKRATPPSATTVADVIGVYERRVDVAGEELAS